MREEGGEKGFGCAGADTVRLRFQRSGSNSGIPLSSSAMGLGVLREPRVLQPPLPGFAGQPRELPTSPPFPRSNASRGFGQPRRGWREGDGAPSVPPNRSPCGQAHGMGSKSEILGNLWREWT